MSIYGIRKKKWQSMVRKFYQGGHSMSVMDNEKNRKHISMGLQLFMFLMIIIPMIYFVRVEARSNDGEVVYKTINSIHDMVVKRISQGTTVASK